MPLHGPILVALDFSTAGAEALVQAHALAKALPAPFVVGHVVPEAFRVRVLFPQEAGIDDVTQQALHRKAEDAVQLHVQSVLGADAAPMQIMFDSGSPHAGILKLADRAGAALIVIGAGATAPRVARSSGRAVLVARPSPADGVVLGASDFSDPSLPALRMAAAEAERRGARLRLIHCLDVDSTAYLAAAGVPGLMAAPPLPDAAIKEMEAKALARLRSAAGAGGGELIVSRLSPHDGILHEAVHVPTSLIVVGTHGRSGFARLALGSVAESVIRDAPCSVLVVPLYDD